MKHTLILALFTGALLLACGGAEADLEGSWTLDPAEVEKEVGTMHAAQREFAKKMLANMKMMFKDGKLTVPTGETYGYQVVETDGDELTLEATDGKDKGDKIKVKIDGDRMTMTSKGKSMRFVRADD